MPITRFSHLGDRRVSKPLDDVHSVAILELDCHGPAQWISQTAGVGLRQSPGRNHLHQQAITAIGLAHFTERAMSGPDLAVLANLCLEHSLTLAVAGYYRAQIELGPMPNRINNRAAFVVGDLVVFVVRRAFEPGSYAGL